MATRVQKSSKLRLRPDNFYSSFRAEGIALKATLEKLLEMTTGAQYGANFKHSSVLIASDSQSFLAFVS